MDNAIKWIVSVSLVSLMTLLSGCIKEDLSDCPRPFNLTVRAFDTEMDDITETGVVQSVVLFVFDETGKRIDRHDLTAEQVRARTPIYIEKFGPKKLTFVAWANLDEPNLSAVGSLTELSELAVRLTSNSGIAQSPNDLFSGMIEKTVEYGDLSMGNPVYLDIFRRTASVNIKVLGYKSWLKRNGYTTAGVTPAYLPNADILIGKTLDTYTLIDELSGNAVQYRPDGQMTPSGDYIIPPFRTYPTKDDQLLSLDFYVQGDKKVSFTKDSNGIPIRPEAGKMLNILIDFRSAQVNVLVVVTPWNVIHQFVVY